MKLKRTNKNKKRLLAATGIVLALLAVGCATLTFTPLGEWLRGGNPDTKQVDTREANTVDYSGPSESDIAESQNAKKNNDSASTKNETTKPAAASSGKTKVAVGISYAGVYNGSLEVRAFTNGVIEGTGTCTATATSGNATVTQSSTAFVDVSTTQCNPIYIPTSQLSPGKWQVTVTFTSPDSEGSSDTAEVSI